MHLLVFESIPTVGSGLILNGALYRGLGGSAGELDEGIFPLGGASEELARLGCLMGRCLNIEALFIYGELSAHERSMLEAALDHAAPEFPNGGIAFDSFYDGTTAVMITGANYPSWDFGTIWQIDEGVSYPYLQWQGGANIPLP